MRLRIRDVIDKAASAVPSDHSRIRPQEEAAETPRIPADFIPLALGPSAGCQAIDADTRLRTIHSRHLALGLLPATLVIAIEVWRVFLGIAGTVAKALDFSRLMVDILGRFADGRSSSCALPVAEMNRRGWRI